MFPNWLKERCQELKTTFSNKISTGPQVICVSLRIEQNLPFAGADIHARRFPRTQPAGTTSPTRSGRCMLRALPASACVDPHSARREFQVSHDESVTKFQGLTSRSRKVKQEGSVSQDCCENDFKDWSFESNILNLGLGIDLTRTFCGSAAGWISTLKFATRP